MRFFFEKGGGPIFAIFPFNDKTALAVGGKFAIFLPFLPPCHASNCLLRKIRDRATVIYSIVSFFFSNL